jgi:uncharacterized protein YukE
MNGFEADPERLAERADEFTELADSADDVVSELRAALDSLGRCWGNDEVGRSFAGTHVGSADDTLGRLGSLGGRLADMGTRFREMADTYRAADDSGARDVNAADT